MIYVDTDALRGVSVLLGRTNASMEEEIRSLYFLVLTMPWNGLARELFVDNFTECYSQIMSDLVILDEMARRLNAIADNYEYIAL